MRKEKQRLVEKEARALTREVVAQLEAGRCSSQMVSKMEAGISRETIINLNHIRQNVLREWSSLDQAHKKSKEIIKTALEMGIRHTLRDLLDEI